MTGYVELVREVSTEKDIRSAARPEDSSPWILYVDDASNNNGSGAGMMLISPEGHKIHYALCFEFLMSNIEVEYRALITGLCLAKELQVQKSKGLQQLPASSELGE